MCIETACIWLSNTSLTQYKPGAAGNSETTCCTLESLGYVGLHSSQSKDFYKWSLKNIKNDYKPLFVRNNILYPIVYIILKKRLEGCANFMYYFDSVKLV